MSYGTTSGMNPQPPPAHLSPSAAEWWRSRVDRFVLEEHHLRLLRLLCEAWDETQTAREQLAKEGFTVPTRDGGMRAHPCVAIERDARLAVCRVLRELDLDLAPPPDVVNTPGRHHSSQIEAAMPVKARQLKAARLFFPTRC
jgi:P27 family predicted phage terminase small subunit